MFPVASRRALAAALCLAAPATAAPLSLGTNTHFGQGWPTRAWDAVALTTAATIREGARWPLIETTPGSYTFTDKTVGHLDRLCAAGRKVILVTKLQNPIYDDGNVVASSGARDAFGNYLAAMASRYRNCLVAIEIGNEVNAGKIAALDPHRFYVNILKAIYPKIKAAAPAVQVLGASSNTVATGYIRDLAKVGLMDWVDGIAIHPYRRDPVNVDWELARLNNAMVAAGKKKPIWITEFSKFFADAGEASDFLAKMAVMMNASGIEQAQWYVLMDFSSVGTMGQYERTGGTTAAGKAFDYFQTQVLPRGTATRVASADPTLFHYRLGADRQILWTTNPRTIAVTGATALRNTKGEAIALPARLGNEPIVVEGNATVTLGEGDTVADSLVSYGRAPWSYFGQRLNNPTRTLEVIDWKWTSFISYPFMRPSGINQLAWVTGGGIKAPITLTMRYTAPTAGNFVAVACVGYKSNTAGIAFEMKRGATTLVTRTIGAESLRLTAPVTLAAGGTVDFITRPAARGEVHNYWYRYRLVKAGTPLPNCPLPGSSTDDPDWHADDTGV
ncbi:hypothetical protein IP88_01150 [alpha proteobacterium AAP81b]|nr:hypothetical protein IP88_01150 [alpha proteobacterium AAP81b]